MADELKIHQAFVAGDLDALRAEIGPAFPRGEFPVLYAAPLEYAIAASPPAFLRTLIDAGADPNYPSDTGYPSLIAALDRKGEDRLAVLDFLISAGADLEQRGVNDFTPLHYAAMLDDPAAIDLLVARGADLGARTRIDNYATPLEEAEILGRHAAAKALRRAVAAR